MVFYRKYRPQTIEELDTDTVRNTLSAILSHQEIPHAFLFTGPKGLGKTSAARIIAKAINCKNKQSTSFEPCNTCDQCISITKGSHVDVLEIDGASHRGIDEIRDLRDKVRLSPSAASKKVYIIDEVHMLTTEAFNALLKTIEEPPSHVIFILCTTEAEKVPDTIKSRCFHVSFQQATVEELLRSFNRIIKKENIIIDDNALRIIAAHAQGGFRDGVKILEEVALRAQGEPITEKFIEGIYKSSSIDGHIASLLIALQEKDAQKALDTIEKISQEGIDMRAFLTELITSLHNLFLASFGVAQSNKYKTSFTSQDLDTLLSLFSYAYSDMKTVIIPTLPTELAISRWCLENRKDILYNSKKETIESLLKKQHMLKIQEALGKQEIVLETQDTAKQTKDTQVTLEKHENNSEKILENLIYKVKPFNYSVAGLLRGCTVQEVTDTTMVIQTAYKFHKDKLTEQKTRTLMEKILKEITGNSVTINVILKGGEKYV